MLATLDTIWGLNFHYHLQLRPAPPWGLHTLLLL
jgi:hypothetical protein